jgi:tripartite-type tricarboxylate transporter receptor subunit TctC
MRLWLAAILTAWAALGNAAEPYPSRPVKLLVAFTAGGTTDIVARMLTPRLTERFKQPFVSENRPGAGGNLGTELACRATPDGYTLIVNTVGPMAVNPTLYKKLACDPLTELVPIAQISDVPNVLVVHPSLNIRTMDQFVAYCRAHSGELNYGSTGIGTSAHLSAFVILQRAGCKATHIPYKGAEALKDLLTGRVQFMFATIPSVIAHIHAGTLTPIAVTSTHRSRSMPDVPTIADSGFPGFQAGSWTALFAPAGTPPDVIAALNKAVNDIIAEKDIESRLIEDGADPVGGSPEKLGAFVRSEFEKWRQVIRESGAKME